jgi:hypothetical protein
MTLTTSLIVASTLPAVFRIPTSDDDSSRQRVSVIVAHFPEDVGCRSDEGRFPGLDLVEVQVVLEGEENREDGR